LCATAVVSGGCVARGAGVAGPQTAKYGGPVSSAAASAPRPVAPARKAVDRPAGTTAPAATHAAARVRQGIDDDAAVGSNTYLYLNAKVPKLIVEVDAVRGYEPAPSALDVLRERLTEVVDKPGGVDFLPTRNIPAMEPGDQQHTSMENTEKKYRLHHSSPSAIVLYILYSDEDPGNGVIGAAYSSSAFAVFKKAIASAATPLVTAEDIEDSVIVHETGHVLALVNIGYRSPRDHEDPNHPNHSKNPRSVMYWAVDNIGVVALLGGSTKPPTAFDADDLADLRDLRDGRLK
jgi:hypothetical protein